MNLSVIIPAALLSLALAQDLSNLQAPRKAKQFVEFTAEPQSIPADKRATLELRFHVLPGYHINSHTPKGEVQIPTSLNLSSSSGTKVDTAQYPAGVPYSFSFAPEEKLDVYQGDFIIKVPVTAAAGSHELKGALNYQACDTAACYPPKSLPLDILFTAR